MSFLFAPFVVLNSSNIVLIFYVLPQNKLLPKRGWLLHKSCYHNLLVFSLNLLLPVRMHERGDPNVVIATATALVYIAEGEEEPAQPAVDYLALLHEFSEMRLLLRSNDDYRIWAETSGERIENRTGYSGTEKRIPFVTVGSIVNMPITWEGTTFTGIIEWGDLSSNGRLEEVTGTVSADGTLIERMVYTYTYRATTRSGNIVHNTSAYWEYANIPIPWPSSNPDRVATLRYELRGEDISQHVVALERYSESSTDGVMTTNTTYLTTHWNDEAAFFLWLYN